jgi:molecular chaperone GrpE
MDDFQQTSEGSTLNDSQQGGGPAGEGVDEGAGGPDQLTELTREEWQRQMDEQKDKYLRLAAEYDNFRKRAVRERQEAGWRGQGELVGGLIEVLDDIMRFADVDKETTPARTVVEGVEMVERKIFKALAGHGLEVVDPVGQPFDPNLHEAVTTEAADSAEEDDLVARVFQTGFVFRGQLLRPARVVVKQWNA